MLADSASLTYRYACRFEIPYRDDSVFAASEREPDFLSKLIAILTLFARSVLEDFVMCHVNTTIYVSMSSIIPATLIIDYIEKFKVIFCVRGVIMLSLENLLLLE